MAAPRFSVLYGLQTDFNVTAELYVYAGDVCEGLADDTPTKALSLKTLFDGKIVVVWLPQMDASSCTYIGGTIEALYPLQRAGAAALFIIATETRMPGYRWYRRYRWSDTFEWTIPIVTPSRYGSGQQFIDELPILAAAGTPVVVNIHSGEASVWEDYANGAWCARRSPPRALT